MQIMQMRRRDEIFEMKFTCPAKSYFFLPNPRPYVRYLDLLLEELLDRWRRFFQNNIFLGADKICPIGFVMWTDVWGYAGVGLLRNAVNVWHHGLA